MTFASSDQRLTARCCAIASLAALTGETPQFEVLELEKFNDEQIRQVFSLQAVPASVRSVIFSSDGQTLASGSDDKT